MPTRSNIVFFGTSQFAVPILERLASSSWRPDLVVTTPDAVAGRRRELRGSPVKEKALLLGLPLAQPDRLLPVPQELAAGAQLFIVAAYGKILPPELLAIPMAGALNIHPSLLPRWRGPSPIPYAILSGDAETGVTIIQMDEQVDHGPIVAVAQYPLADPAVTTDVLATALSELAADLLIQTIPRWLNHAHGPHPQRDGDATFSKLLRKDDGAIDWRKSAREIERMTRAFHPWPGAYTFLNTGANRVRLLIAPPVSTRAATDRPSVPGTVVARGEGFEVATGDGALGVWRVKPEGGVLMDAAAFLRGHPAIAGSVLG